MQKDGDKDKNKKDIEKKKEPKQRSIIIWGLAHRVYLIRIKDNQFYINLVATIYIYKNVEFFIKFNPTYLDIKVANGEIIIVKQKGICRISYLINGDICNNILSNIYFVSEVSNNLISLGTLQNIGMDYQSAPKGMEIFRRGELIFTPKLRGIIYILFIIEPQLAFAIDAVNLVGLVEHSDDFSENLTKFNGENIQDASSSKDKTAVCSKANKHAVIAIKISTNVLIELQHHYLAYLNE